MSINSRIQLRRGTSTEWALSSTILASGEAGYDTDQNNIKIGNGASGWADLPWLVNSSSLSGQNTYAATGNFDVISFNVDDESALLKGDMSWDDTEGTVTLGLTDTVAIHIGEHRFYRVRNTTGGTLYKGQVVYATGVHSNGVITPDLYIADGSIDEIRFIGSVLEDIDHNNNGYVIDFGHLQNMDLDGSATNFAVGNETWSAGDILYAHPTASGKLTNVEPKHAITIAIILDVGNGNTNGSMFVRPSSHGDLEDIHNIDVTNLEDNQFLVYNSGVDYWQPSSGLYLVDGQLGVGTSAPNSTLHVYSSTAGDDLLNVEGSNGSLFSVVDSLSGTLMSVNTAAGLPALEVNSDYSLTAGRFNQSDFVITSGGNVGIGTDNPITKLDISGVITASGGNSDEWNQSYDWINASGTANIGGSAYTVPFWNSTADALSYSSNLTFDSSNKLTVGVGTANYRFNVYGDAGISSTLYAAGFAFFGDNLNAITKSTNLLTFSTSTPDRDFSFGSYSGSTYTTSFYINNGTRSSRAYNDFFVDGNLGVGTLSPSYKVDVSGTGNFSGDVYASGNLGVGTSSPNATIHAYSATSGAMILNVEGTYGSLFSVRDNLSGVLMNVNTVAGLPALEIYDDYSLIAGRYAQNDFVITAGGDIGMGIAAPSGKLHIYDNNSAGWTDTSFRIQNPASPNNTYFDIAIGTSTGYGDHVWFKRNDVPVASIYSNNTFYHYTDCLIKTDKQFVAESNGNAFIELLDGSNDTKIGYLSDLRFYSSYVEKMVLDVNGNLGIGTTSPTEKLHVYTTGVGQGALIGSSKIGNWEGDATYASFTHNDVHSTTTSYALLQSNNGTTFLNSADSTSLSLRINNVNSMVVDSSRSIRMLGGSSNNTWSSPSTTLSLKNGINTPSITFHGNDGSRIGFIQMSSAADAYYNVEANQGFRIKTNNLDRLYIAAGGNVGIGTTNPQYTLDVNGTSNLGGNVVVGGNLTVNGSTVSANIDTLDIKDPILTLGLASGNIVVDDSYDRGIAMVTNNGTAFMGWDNSADKFVMLASGVATNSSGNYDAGTYGDLVVNKVYGSGLNTHIQLNAGSNSIMLNSDSYAGSHTHINTQYTSLNGASTYVNGVLSFPKNGTATSTATQKDSRSITLFNSMWNGSAELQTNVEIASFASTTVNERSRLAFLTTNEDGTNNKVERLSILTNGNVGIGTTAPSNKLEVNSGSINVTNNDVTAYRVGGTAVLGKAVISSGFSSYVNGATRLSGPKIVFTANNNADVSMTIDSNHRLGIGTETPSAMIHTVAQSGIIAAKFAGPDTRLDIDQLDTTTMRIKPVGNLMISAGNSAAIRFAIDSVEYARFKNNGYFGIGETNPLYKLEVKNGAPFFYPNETGAEAASLNLGRYTTGYGAFMSIITQDETVYRTAFKINRYVGRYRFSIADGTLGTEHMAELRPVAGGNTWDLYNFNNEIKTTIGAGTAHSYINGGGSLGIGTNTPTTLLDVSGVITASGGNSNEWNQAYDWGNHASAGYVTLTGVQTLTNKTLHSPNIVSGVFQDTFTIGSQIFYEQGTNGFSVNEDFDPSNSSTQTAYHFTTGSGRETLAFTLARTSQFTDGFGIYGTSSDNTFVTFGEQSNTKFEWRKGIGIRPLDLDGGTLLMRLNTNGNLDVSGSGIFGSGIDINGAADFSSTINAPNLGAGEDNSVVILDSDGKLRTDEIDSRVWGSSLVDGTGSASGVAFWTDANTLSYDSGLTWDSGNNRLGIGTTTPVFDLDVRTNSTNAFYVAQGAGARYLAFGSTGFINNTTLAVSKSTWNGNATIEASTTIATRRGLLIEQAASQTANAIETRNNTGTALSYITSAGGAYFAGDVGIGTASPAVKLEVQGAGSGSGIQDGLVRLRSTNASNPPGLMFINSGNTSTYNDLGNIQGVIESGNAIGGLRFITRNSDGNNTGVGERVRISAAGNVGIGTTTPAQKLHISSTGHTEIQIDAGTNSNPGVRLTNDAQNWVMRLAGDSSDEFQIRQITGTPSNRLVINTSGNVGIGTDSPTEKLQVVQESASSTVYLDVKNSSNVISSPAGIKLSTNYLGTVKSSLIYDNWTGAGMTFQASRDLATSQGGFNWVAADSTSMMVLRRASSNNWLGLNTTSPTQTMDIRYPAGGGMALLKSTDTTDGLLFGDMAYSASNDYQGVKHAAMGGANDYMIMSNGTNTYISAASGGSVYVNTGGNDGVSQVKLTPTEVVINDSSLSNDFRVESNNNANMLFVDGGNDRVSIGTSTTHVPFTVYGDCETSIANANGGSHNMQIIDNRTLASGVGGAIGLGGKHSGSSNTIFAEIKGIKENGTSGDYASALTLHTRANGGNLTERVRIDSAGNVGIGTATPNNPLEIYANGPQIKITDALGAKGAYIEVDHPNNNFNLDWWSTTTRNINFINSSTGGIKVGVNTTTPSTEFDVAGSGNFSGDVTIDGHLSAATKSFLINHPTREGHKLQYGSLESPYHGVRLTGRAKVENGWCVVKLPEYISELVHNNNDINIQITNIKHSKILYVDDTNIANNEFTVKTDSWFNRSGLEFYWTFTAVRKDVKELQVEF